VIYGLDCEFNGFGGELISLALSGEAGELYLVRPEAELEAMQPHAWVEENVLPYLSLADARPDVMPLSTFGRAIQAFLLPQASVTIIADWPEDLKHLMQCLIVAPGQMVRIPNLTLKLVQAAAYPNSMTEAVQHNALWDARALRKAVCR
jgi:hypothetical protein